MFEDFTPERCERVRECWVKVYNSLTLRSADRLEAECDELFHFLSYCKRQSELWSETNFGIGGSGAQKG